MLYLYYESEVNGMKDFDRNIAWLFALLALVVGMAIGKHLPSNEPVSTDYDKGYAKGYEYAVKTARLVADDGATYTIVYGENDGNYYTR